MTYEQKDWRVFNLHGTWLCEVAGQLQAPTWNSRGAAEAFAQAVAAGKRSPEPCKLFNKRGRQA